LPSIENNALITAPHHGSEHNLAAYLRLKSLGLISPETIFVRSDGKFRKRPSSDYVNLKTKKLCTLCRSPKANRQNVKLLSSKFGWKRGIGVAWCCCI